MLNKFYLVSEHELAAWTVYVFVISTVLADIVVETFGRFSVAFLPVGGHVASV